MRRAAGLKVLLSSRQIVVNATLSGERESCCKWWLSICWIVAITTYGFAILLCMPLFYYVSFINKTLLKQ
jgi:hypothetical protein